MTMIGIDPHKATHTAVAVDRDERVIGEFTLEASGRQVDELTEWADGFQKRGLADLSARDQGRPRSGPVQRLRSRVSLPGLDERVVRRPIALADADRVVGRRHGQYAAGFARAERAT